MGRGRLPPHRLRPKPHPHRRPRHQNDRHLRLHVARALRRQGGTLPRRGTALPLQETVLFQYAVRGSPESQLSVRHHRNRDEAVHGVPGKGSHHHGCADDPRSLQEEAVFDGVGHFFAHSDALFVLDRPRCDGAGVTR